MGSRTQGVQEILKNIGCPHPHKSEGGDGARGVGQLRAVLHSNSFANNLRHGSLNISVTFNWFHGYVK